MSYKVRYHPLVKEKDLSKINNTIKTRIKNAIERRLMADPVKYGDPLRKTLKGYRKLRVGDYRTVYKIENGWIFILGIRHRKEIYKKVELRIQSIGFGSTGPLYRQCTLGKEC